MAPGINGHLTHISQPKKSTFIWFWDGATSFYTCLIALAILPPWPSHLRFLTQKKKHWRRARSIYSGDGILIEAAKSFFSKEENWKKEQPMKGGQVEYKPPH
jgi:hypothetical protein